MIFWLFGTDISYQLQNPGPAQRQFQAESLLNGRAKLGYIPTTLPEKSDASRRCETGFDAFCRKSIPACVISPEHQWRGKFGEPPAQGKLFVQLPCELGDQVGG